MGTNRNRGRSEIGIQHLIADHQLKPQYYGRRRGHKLRPGRQRLVDRKLPDLRFPGPEDGPETVASACAELRRAYEDVWLEIGFGAGENLADQAQRHPEIGFIGCEPFENGVASLVAAADRAALEKLRIFDNDVRLLLPMLPAEFVGRVFVLFPDPWPKRRHRRRRMISSSVLAELARIMRDDAELRFATDHMEYARWTLEHLVNHRAFSWDATGPDDWRRRPDDAAATRYEMKAIAANRDCVHLSFTRCARL